MPRLILLVILFLLSLLTVFKAPAYYLWLAAIMVSEYPLIFVGISVLLTSWGIWNVPYRLAGNIIGMLSIMLFLSPIFRAYWISKDLKQEMVESLSGADTSQISYPNRQPFALNKLFAPTQTVPFKMFTYVNYRDTSLKLNFYPSRVLGKRPCVIVVHGGSWSSGDSMQLPELNSFLAARGYHVASINYRLAPKYKTPAPVEDIKNCLKYLREHADKLYVDTNKFILLGRSAGAQIALLAGYTLHDSSIIGVVDFYGPADMVWGYSIPSNPLIMDSRKVMVNYIGGKYEQVPDQYKACSPLEFVNKQSPPTLIIHGNNDVLVAYEHSRRLNERLQQNGIKHYWLKLPWATHGFDYNINGPGGQLSTYAVETFLNSISSNPSAH
jgi:acetyl esterase/lipase